MDEKKIVKESEFEGLSGIFITEYEMSNMKMERIVVSNPAILAILKVTKLSEKAQEDAIFALVDRTNWAELDNEVQVQKIKATLTQETVIHYLKHQGVIKDKCDVVQTGVDQEGSVVIEAYYTQLSREQRRLIEKATPKKKREEMERSINILSGQDNLVNLAEKRLQKLQKSGTIKEEVKGEK